MITFLENMVHDIPRNMKVYKALQEISTPPKNAVVTIGNFDGIHLGHQQLIRSCLEHARKIDGTVVVITFRPHPRFVIRPPTEPHLLNTYEERLNLLASYGVQVVLEQPFSREFSNISAEQFVKDHLVNGFQAKALYLGYDFTFGKERGGSVETLKNVAQGMEIHLLPALESQGEVVSSSRIRKALDQGDMQLTTRLLGRKFFLSGLVWRGEGRGRQIGVPTANLQTENRRYPKVGVYATRTQWRGNWYPSVSNIGYNPTFKGDGTDLPLKIETHLFDFSQDMYGDEIQVEFFEFIRSEKKFAGFQELLHQMKDDFAKAKEILGSST